MTQYATHSTTSDPPSVTQLNAIHCDFVLASKFFLWISYESNEYSRLDPLSVVQMLTIQSKFVGEVDRQTSRDIFRRLGLLLLPVHFVAI